MIPNRPINENIIYNPENLNSEDIKKQQEQRIKDIEIDPDRKMQRQSPYSASQLPQSQMPVQNASVQASIQNQPTVDPVTQVKSMLTGYTPSANLIQDTPNLVKNGNQDWSNTWFAVLLQKLIKSKKK
ncbi:MAG: hypothetical protein WCJ19_04785 [bacterium]